MSVEKNVHSKPKVGSRANRPSQWREKYGVRATVEQSQIGHVLLCTDEEEVQDFTDREALVPRAYFEALTTDFTPADEDAFDVISEMKKLLDGVLPSRCISVDFRDVGLHENSGLDFQAPSIDAQLKVKSANLIAPHEEAFSGESMAILFRRSHDEKFTRKCFLSLLSHSREVKLLRNRAFFGWKRIARDANDTDNVLIRRFQRRHRLRHIRRLFSSWLKVRAISHDLLKRAAQIHALRMSHRGLIAWSRLSRRKKSRRVEHSRRINMAKNIRDTKLKHSFFVRWLRYTGGNNDKLKSSFSDEVKACSVVILEEDDSRPTSIGQNVTPEKNVLLDVPKTVQHTKFVDGNENQPKRTKKNNLLPLKHQRRNTGIPSTPNLVLKMKQRKEEREKGRELLRQRYEQKAIEKQQRLEEERIRREEAETKVQREYVRHKTLEEQRKKMATERWKRACRLAALHFQMSLQKRMLLQWKHLFRVRDFHERKVRKECAAILN